MKGATLSPSLRPETLVSQVDSLRAMAAATLDRQYRAERGQFFTSPHIAQFMAQMFRRNVSRLSILDAGAGVGTLSAAMVVEAIGWDPKPERVIVTACENEPSLIRGLEETLGLCAGLCEQAGIAFEARIIRDDFVEVGARWLQGGTLFEEGPTSFNAAILNPPYRKINGHSKFRQALHAVGIETGNLYAAFVWLALRLLEDDGELAAITPRSFCNGPYFRPFRLALDGVFAFQDIHVFESRDKVFQEDDVLQENVIFHGVKSDEHVPVRISSTAGPEDLASTVREIPRDELIRPEDPDRVIHITPDERGRQFQNSLNRLEGSLAELGLSVSTGRVVDFRARHLLADGDTPDAVPLIYPGNLTGGFVRWPEQSLRKPNALIASLESADLVLPAEPYVLVKRFSAKEERRRVVAAMFDPSRVAAVRVGFENHLNYYHANGHGLPLEFAKGLTAYLNSTWVDEYFRQFSGHTQVNASDLRGLPYPAQEQLAHLGSRLGFEFPDQAEIDRLVAEELRLMPDDPAQMNPLAVKQKMEEALAILRALELPRAQLNDRSALTLLALLDIRPNMSWGEASDPLRGITEMMDYFREHYGVTYAPNTRETVRRQTIHQFVQVGLAQANPDAPDRPVNSPDYNYQIEASVLRLIRAFGAPDWEEQLDVYLRTAGARNQLRAKEREMRLIRASWINGEEIVLTPGGQNELIKSILEGFCPRYTPDGTLVYVDDAGQKYRKNALAYLAGLHVALDEHGKMPDVIVHFTQKGWLVLIEAVTSHGPIDIKRHNELQRLFAQSSASLVYVTAFSDRKTMTRYLTEIAWETEVWVAEAPSHLIHFNGERFLGPY